MESSSTHRQRKEKTWVLIDVAIPADRNVQKEAEKWLKYVQEFIYRYTTNVEYETSDYTSNDWSHRNIIKRFKEKFGETIQYVHYKTQIYLKLYPQYGKYCSLKLES
jgi:hypothetical protein